MPGDKGQSSLAPRSVLPELKGSPPWRGARAAEVDPEDTALSTVLNRRHIRLTTVQRTCLLVSAAVPLLLALSIPDASPVARWVIDRCKRLPRRLRLRLGGLIAAQFVFVARARSAG